MKRIELLTLSVVTATLIVATGCSSDDDDKKASGPSAPQESAAPVELNESVARNAIALITRDNNSMMLPSAARGPDRNISNSGTTIRDCDISGTVTTTYVHTETDLGNASWSEVDAGDQTYDNCVDNSGNPSFDTMTRTGTYSYRHEKTYDAETGLTTEIYKDDGHSTSISENNNTQHSYTDNYSMTEESTIVYIDNGKLAPKANLMGPGFSPRTTVSAYFSLNGEDKWVMTDDTGKIVDGGKTVAGAFNTTIEYVYDGSRHKVSEKSSTNGFISHYDINSSGDENLTSSSYFKDYVVHWYVPDNGSGSDGDEEAIKISGTIGDLCLGGSITIATDPTIFSNQVKYKDKDDNHGDDVLPYAGAQQISGSNTLTVGFEHNATLNTSATVTIGSESKVYGSWAELLAGSSCAEDD